LSGLSDWEEIGGNGIENGLKFQILRAKSRKREIRKSCHVKSA